MNTARRKFKNRSVERSFGQISRSALLLVFILQMWYHGVMVAWYHVPNGRSEIRSVYSN